MATKLTIMVFMCFPPELLLQQIFIYTERYFHVINISSDHITLQKAKPHRHNDKLCIFLHDKCFLFNWYCWSVKTFYRYCLVTIQILFIVCYCSCKMAVWLFYKLSAFASHCRNKRLIMNTILIMSDLFN